LFDLALHSWTEPIERVLLAAEASDVTVMSPQPGQSVQPAQYAHPAYHQHWWPKLPFQTAQQAPVVSSGLR
jgi:hypothetical protein